MKSAEREKIEKELMELIPAMKVSYYIEFAKKYFNREVKRDESGKYDIMFEQIVAEATDLQCVDARDYLRALFVMNLVPANYN